jgi:DNA topoisomerase-3
VVEVDFTGQEPVGKCPKCGNRVFENVMSYVCEKAVGGNRTCDFRSGKVILQREIDRAQMVKLLTTGRTDLLPKFISKKGRPFSAFLVVGEGGKVGFEFAPRAPKAPKAAKTPKSKPATPSSEPASKE